MAKQTGSATGGPKGFAQMILIASIAWFRDLNIARSTGQYGKPDELVVSLHKEGWLLTPDGVITVEPASDSMKERALKDRQTQWERLQELAKADSGKLLELAVFEELYCIDGKKLKSVEYIGISGNRRSEAFFPAMCLRRRDNLPITTEIPACIRTFDSPLARLEEQIRENQDKILGFRPPTDVDNLLAAQMAVELGANQAQLRKVYKDGTGQKLWGLLCLARRFPELRMVERFQLQGEDPNYLRLSAFSNKFLPDLVLRTDPTALADKNQTLRMAGKEELKPAGVEDVARFLTETSQGSATATDGVASKVMKGDAIRGIATAFPSRPLREMAQAIAENDSDRLRLYQANANVFNMLDSLVREGDGPRIELILAAVNAVKNGGRDAVIERLHAAIATPNA